MSAWEEVLARLGRAADALEIPRDQVDALLQEHGAEVQAWTDDKEVSGTSLIAFHRFCREQGISLDWIYLADEVSLLLYTRAALTK